MGDPWDSSSNSDSTLFELKEQMGVDNILNREKEQLEHTVTWIREYS